MRYAKLLERVAELAGVDAEVVRRVLHVLPDAIMELDEGDNVRTQLGVFRLLRERPRRTKDPQGRWTWSRERLVARIRPGERLRRTVSESSQSSEAEPDGDPTA